jgi:hypothetical protein
VDGLTVDPRKAGLIHQLTQAPEVICAFGDPRKQSFALLVGELRRGAWALLGWLIVRFQQGLQR